MPRRTETVEEVTARLAAGEDLSTGQIAIIMDMSRFAVDYWLVEGITLPNGERWRPEHRSTPGGHRKVYASEVRKLLDLAKDRQSRPPRSSRGRASADHPPNQPASEGPSVGDEP